MPGFGTKSTTTEDNTVARYDVPLAIVGMACRLPGANNLEEYWELILHGKSAIGEIPADRFDRSLYFDARKGQQGKSYATLAGLLGPDEPVEHFYGLTAAEITRADPFQLQMLPLVAEAFAHAGIDPVGKNACRGGVFIGHSRGAEASDLPTYFAMLEQVLPSLKEVASFRNAVPDPAAFVDQFLKESGQSESANERKGEVHRLSRLISRAFGLTGPALTINAACASSLIAMAAGCDALQRGEIDVAVIGGASCFKFASLVQFSQAQALSASGSHPFDADADGFVAAEGRAVVVVKRLDRALAEGNAIQAVIGGIGISSDGRGKSLWAPREEGQLAALRRAYRDSDQHTRIGYIEAHATSTPVGDATEASAIVRFFRESNLYDSTVRIGSIKANIGHTLEVAGVAGLIKTVLAIQHKTIPPAINVAQPSRRIDWKESPLSLPRTAEDWPAPIDKYPRVAGVNSFGIGGCNAHVIVEEYRPALHGSGLAEPTTDEVAAEPIAIVGSALLQFDENQKFDYDWSRHKIPPKQIAAADPLQFMLLEAVDRAVNQCTDAGGSLPGNSGVVIGARSAGQFATEQQLMLRLPELCARLAQQLQKAGVEAGQASAICDEFREMLSQRFPALEDETGSYSSSTLATRISKAYDLTGGAFAIDQGDLSSLSALFMACQMLRSGRCDTVVCGAGSREFSSLRTPNEKQAATIPGDGAAVVILKRLSVAQTAGDPILGMIEEIAISGKESVENCSTAATRGAMSGLFEIVESIEATSGTGESRTLDIRDEELSGRVVFRSSRSQQIRRVSSTTADCSSRVFRFEAATREKLFQQIDSVVKAHNSELGLEKFGTARFRVSVVARNLADLQKQLKAPRFQQLRASRRTLYADKRVFFRDMEEASGKLAFLFPGQGSQYQKMGLDWRNANAENREIFDELSQLLTANCAPRLEDLVRDEDQLLGRDVRRTKLAVLAMNAFHLRRLTNYGISPDVVTGHSLGEHAALIAAGCWDFETAVRTIQSRCDILERGQANGGMLSCFAPADAVFEAIGEVDSVFVTHRNTPRQTIIGGTEQGIERAREKLRAARIVTQPLSSQYPFHSPIMKGQQAAFRDVLKGVSLRSPTLPFLSGVSLQTETDDESIRDLLVRQLVSPVDFVLQIQRLYCEGVRLFLEVGPGSVLTQLARSILGHETDFHALAVDQRESDASENQLALSAFAEINDLEKSGRATLSIPKIAETRPGNICQRYVLRHVESAAIQKSDANLDRAGSCLILGANEVAGRLARQLQETGARVVRLDAEDSREQLFEKMTSAWKQGELATLILATPWDADAVRSWGAELWEKRQFVGVRVPYFVAQKWVSLIEAEARIAPAKLLLLGRWDGESATDESGALVGLTKAIGREFAELIETRVIEFSSDLNPAEIAERTLRELRISSGANEVIWSRDGRDELKLVAEDLPDFRNRVPRFKTWIVTGGARGVTAQIALGLAKQGPCKLHLIGISPVPEIDPAWRDLDDAGKSALRQQVIRDAIERGISPPVRAWEGVEKSIEIERTLQLIREAGTGVTYHSCDLSEREQVRTLLQNIRAADGPIEGIIHGAGFERSARFSKKDPELAERTIASKVDSAFHLMSLTRDDPVKCFIAFGSISGQFGSVGQTDYCLANGQLSKLVAWYRQQRPEIKATTIAWHSWAEVGMAMRPESQFSKQQQDWEYLPVAEGVAHFLNELSAGCPEPEVVITTPAHHTRMTAREKQEFALIDAVDSVRPDQFVARVTLDPVGDPFLAQHTLRGRPLLPLAMAAELLVQSVVATGEAPKQIAIRNLRATEGFKFLNEGPHSATIEATRDGNHWNCRLSANLVNRAGRILKPNVERFSGRVVLNDGNGSDETLIGLVFSQLNWKEFAYRESADSLVHGPVLQAVKKVCLEKERLYARIVAPVADEIAPARHGRWVLPVAVLDACLFSAGLLHWQLNEARLGIPNVWDNCTFYRNPRPGEVCIAVVELLESAGNQTRYQITLCSETGERLLQIAGCRVVEVPFAKRGIEVQL